MIPPTTTTTRMELTTTWRCRRSGVVRIGSQAGGLASFDPLLMFVLAFLRQNLFTYVYTQIILASTDSFEFELMYSSPRGPWLVI